MRRCFLEPSTSRYGLKVGTDDPGNSANPGEPFDFIDGRLSCFQRILQRFNGNVQADLVPIFETVGYGFRRSEDAHWNSLQLVDLNALFECLLGIADQPVRDGRFARRTTANRNADPYL